MAKPHRYWVRSPDGRAVYGFDKESTANAVAFEYGLGAAVIDTLAQAYMPMLQIVESIKGEPKLVLAPVGGWDTGRFGLDRDLIEAVKKGRAEIVHAFLAKGASPKAVDGRGGSVLHWAAARGETDIAELLLGAGADVNATDAEGRTPLAVAEARGKAELADFLRRRGAR